MSSRCLLSHWSNIGDGIGDDVESLIFSFLDIRSHLRLSCVNKQSRRCSGVLEKSRFGKSSWNKRLHVAMVKQIPAHIVNLLEFGSLSGKYTVQDLDELCAEAVPILQKVESLNFLLPRTKFCSCVCEGTHDSEHCMFRYVFTFVVPTFCSSLLSMSLVSMTYVNEWQLMPLIKLNRLQRLYINNCALGALGEFSVGKLPKSMKSISLCFCDHLDNREKFEQFFEGVETLENLVEIRVYNSSCVNRNFFWRLSKLKKLRRIDLSWCLDLKIGHDPGERSPQSSPGEEEAFPSLMELKLYSCKSLEDSCMDRLLEEAKAIYKLDVRYCSKISTHTIRRLNSKIPLLNMNDLHF